MELLLIIKLKTDIWRLWSFTSKLCIEMCRLMSSRGAHEALRFEQIRHVLSSSKQGENEKRLIRPTARAKKLENHSANEKRR